MRVYKRNYYLLGFLLALLIPGVVVAQTAIKFAFTVENISDSPLIDVKVAHYTGGYVSQKYIRENIPSVNDHYNSLNQINLTTISTDPDHLNHMARNGRPINAQAWLTGFFESIQMDYWTVSFYTCEKNASCEFTNVDGIVEITPDANEYKKNLYELASGSAPDKWTDPSIHLKRCDVTAADEGKVVEIQIAGSKKNGFSLKIKKPGGNCDEPFEKHNL